MFYIFSGGGGATLPRNGGAEKFRGDQQSGHAPRFGPEIQNGRSSAKDGALERLRYGCSFLVSTADYRMEQLNMSVENNGIWTLARKMTSFRFPEYVFVL